MTPRVLFAARTRYALPLTPTLQRRFDALSDVIDWRQFGTSATGEDVADERFTLVGRFPVARLDGAAFYGALPVRLAREIRAFRPDVLVVQGAEDTALALVARRLARSSVPVVFDVHGDWRNNTRVYGSPGRRLISPVADGLARLTLRHADAVRTVSGFTSGLVREQGVEPIATFPAYMDLGPFLEPPPAAFPTQPSALFVGVLEKYKAIDVLAAAWRRVVAARPGARLQIVGAGRLESIVRSLVDEPAFGVRWTERLDTAGRRTRARRGDAPRAPVAAGRDGPRDRRGLLPRSSCGRHRGRAAFPTSSRTASTGLLVPADDVEALAGSARTGSRRRRPGGAARGRRERFSRRLVGDAGGVRAPRSGARRRACLPVPVPRLQQCLPTQPSNESRTRSTSGSAPPDA